MTFSGTVSSDFLNLVNVESAKQASLVDYTAQDFDSIKAKLVEYAKAVYPLTYQNFAEDDYGMMILEWMAYWGAIATHKADFNVNENFIRTAKNRNNVKDLLRLVGVRMKGPISAAADAKITWASDTSPSITIDVSDRVVNLQSPEDGGSISFILYKVTNGQVDLEDATGDITLNASSSDDDGNKVFSNLVLLEGTLIKETGTFASSEKIKSIELTQSPVIESSVQVYMEGDTTTSGAYTEVENIYSASSSSDKVFQVITDDDFQATVVFGDNVIGQAPRAGDTYTVFYRVGGGTRGNIGEGVINDTSISVGGNTSVLTNTSPGTGGQDAETVDHAKKYAPLTFRRQDRLVSLTDYKTFGNTYIGSYGNTGKVTASVRKAFASANVIDVFVLERANDHQLRRATPQFKLNLLDSMNNYKMLTDELVIVDGLIRTLDLVITLRLDKEYRGKEEDIKLKVRDVIQNYFSVDNNDFGKELNLLDLNRAIFEVKEVRFSTIDNLDRNVKIDFNEIIQLNNLQLNVVFV